MGVIIQLKGHDVLPERYFADLPCSILSSVSATKRKRMMSGKKSAVKVPESPLTAAGV